MRGNLVPGSPVRGSRTAGGGGCGVVASPGGRGVCPGSQPKLRDGSAPRRVPGVGWDRARRPGLPIAPPLPGPGRWTPEGRAGGDPPRAGTPEDTAWGSVPAAPGAAGLGPSRLTSEQNHPRKPNFPSPSRCGRARTTRRSRRWPQRRHGWAPAKPTAVPPAPGSSDSTQLLPAASQLGRGRSKERGGVSMGAGSQRPFPPSPNTCQVKPQFGGEDGGLGAAGMAPVA